MWFTHHWSAIVGFSKHISMFPKSRWYRRLDKYYTPLVLSPKKIAVDGDRGHIQYTSKGDSLAEFEGMSRCAIRIPNKKPVTPQINKKSHFFQFLPSTQFVTWKGMYPRKCLIIFIFISAFVFYSTKKLRHHPISKIISTQLENAPLQSQQGGRAQSLSRLPSSSSFI